MKLIKTILMYLLSYSLIMNATFASVPLRNTAADIFNDLEFSLAVEWDQENTEQHAQILKRFETEIDTKLQDGSLTKGELLTLLEGKITDKALKVNLGVIVEKIGRDKLNAAQIKALINKYASKQITGASWTSGGRFGENSGLILWIVGITAAYVGYLYWNANSEYGFDYEEEEETSQRIDETPDNGAVCTGERGYDVYYNQALNNLCQSACHFLNLGYFSSSQNKCETMRSGIIEHGFSESANSCPACR